MIRDDLSNKLIHLTRGEPGDAKAAKEHAFERFHAIVTQKKLIGGTGYIKGGYQCVCFTEAPISKLSHILASGPAAGVRYAPFGVMVNKQWLFQKGGRPVIYGPDPDFEKLPEEMRYRHVRFWLSPEYSVDHTWEREWRLQADELPLDPAEVTLVVPDRDTKEVFLEHVSPDWHFIVLSDLGVDVPFL
jgi:hypothetical protein